MPTNRGIRTGTYTANTGITYGGSLGGATYPLGPTVNPKLTAAIDDLLTPGLVPDIARMSAEIAAGRGIAGSPAADSTAVRMSEQNWLQRLGLANSLMSGQTGRDLPYQITPYQQAWLELQKSLRGLNQGGMSFGGGQPRGGGGMSFGGGYGGKLGPMNTPWAGFPIIEAVGGTRPTTAGSGGGIVSGGYQGGMGGLGVGTTMGGGAEDWTLDDAYDWLGFGDFGSLPGDVGTLGGSNDYYPYPGVEEPGIPGLFD